MKLGKLNKALILLMGLALSTPMVMAQETEKIIAVETGESSQSTAVEEEVIEEGLTRFSDEEMVEFIKAKGTPVGVSKEVDGVKITVEYILADRYMSKVLLSVEHLDKKPFAKEGDSTFRGMGELRTKEEYEKEKILEALPEDATLADYIKAYATIDESYKKFIKADGSVDEEGAIKEFEQGMEDGGSASSSFWRCDLEDEVPYKKYFILSSSSMDRGQGEMIFELGEYEEYQDVEFTPTLDLVAYLSKHQAVKTKVNELDEEEKEYLEKLKNENEKAYERHLAYLSERPKNILVDQDLELKVLDNVDNFMIKSIGFVDDALHISFIIKGEGLYFLEMYDANGDYVCKMHDSQDGSMDEAGNHIATRYEVYPIKNVAELKNYKIKVQSNEQLIKGKEHCQFEMNLKPIPEKVIKVNKTINLDNQHKGVLKTITQTDLSLTLEFEDLNKKLDDDYDIKVITKDGEGEAHTNATRVSKNQGTFVYNISDVKEKIEKIVVGDIEVKLN